MENKEYLSESEYIKNKKKISKLSLMVLVIGLLIGGSLVALGIVNIIKVNSKYSTDSKAELTDKLNNEKQSLEARIDELEAKGLTFDSFAKYTDGENYELKIITNVLNPSFNHCKFDEYKNNTVTSNYCSLKLQLEDFDDGFSKSYETHKNIPFFMIGGFIIIASCMISGSIYMVTKRREIVAFTTQQVMPVAEEGIEKMAPTIGKVAKEISKGIKEGLNSDEE